MKLFQCPHCYYEGESSAHNCGFFCSECDEKIPNDTDYCDSCRENIREQKKSEAHEDAEAKIVQEDDARAHGLMPYKIPHLHDDIPAGAPPCVTPTNLQALPIETAEAALIAFEAEHKEVISQWRVYLAAAMKEQYDNACADALAKDHPGLNNWQL
jgi:hypothetical protein